MLTIEMKINGILIGQIYAHNQGYEDATDLCSYNYHCYLMDMKGNPSIAEGVVLHRRNEGFLKLAGILSDAAEEALADAP